MEFAADNEEGEGEVEEEDNQSESESGSGSGSNNENSEGDDGNENYDGQSNEDDEDENGDDDDEIVGDGVKKEGRSLNIPKEDLEYLHLLLSDFYSIDHKKKLSEDLLGQVLTEEKFLSENILLALGKYATELFATNFPQLDASLYESSSLPNDALENKTDFKVVNNLKLTSLIKDHILTQLNQKFHLVTKLAQDTVTFVKTETGGSTILNPTQILVPFDQTTCWRHMSLCISLNTCNGGSLQIHHTNESQIAYEEVTVQNKIVLLDKKLPIAFNPVNDGIQMLMVLDVLVAKPSKSKPTPLLYAFQYSDNLVKYLTKFNIHKKFVVFGVQFFSNNVGSVFFCYDSQGMYSYRIRQDIDWDIASSFMRNKISKVSHDPKNASDSEESYDSYGDSIEKHPGGRYKEIIKFMFEADARGRIDYKYGLHDLPKDGLPIPENTPHQHLISNLQTCYFHYTRKDGYVNEEKYLSEMEFEDYIVILIQ